MITWTQLGFQDGLSPTMEEFIIFHDYAMVIVVFIVVFVALVLEFSRRRLFINQALLEGQTIETIWTVLPAIVLIQIAVPSLTLLYCLEETEGACLTIKVIAHQWFWSYEYSDFWGRGGEVRFDCYIKTGSGGRRLLDLDNHTVLPFLSSVRALVNSADVLHSWAIPSLGVKVDASPGRINQVFLRRFRPGLAFGQCSEICGANHRFMPICVETVRVDDFIKWAYVGQE